MFESLKRHQRQSLGRERCEPKIQNWVIFETIIMCLFPQIFISISVFKPRPKIRGKLFFEAFEALESSRKYSFDLYGILYLPCTVSYK